LELSEAFARRRPALGNCVFRKPCNTTLSSFFSIERMGVLDDQDGSEAIIDVSEACTYILEHVAR